MRTIWRIAALLICIVLIFSLTACDSTDKAYIYFTLQDTPLTVDPQTAQSDTELMIVRNVFEGLLRKDESGKIVCGVAEKYKNNNLTYTFNLKKDAIWSDETPITANDFVFAFRRAVNPETQSPFVSRFLAIKNAKAIIAGKKSVNSLGVAAINDFTLKIVLEEKDPNFEETLTTSVAMPCNEKFFYSCAGKYGLEKETTLSNGSYRLAKWGKEIFGIRLYRNDFYKGDFKAKNAAVFISTDKDRTPVQVLADGESDIAFIKPQDIATARNANLKTAEFENICWFLTISDGFSKGLRKALITLANPQVFSKNLTDGYGVANGIYPPVFADSSSSSGMLVYDLENAKKLFKSEVENLKDKKFPTDVVLYYYDDGFSKNLVTDIVGHWQNQLGAFVNIESVSSPTVLLSQLETQTYAMSIFPVNADSPNIDEYLEKFGIKNNNESLGELQSKLLKSNNLVPLITQKTIVSYTDELKNLNFTHGNGCIDFAYIIKKS